MGATGTRQGGLTLSTQQWAWVFVLLFFVLGDVVTTSVGLSMTGIAERNVVLRPVVESFGVAGMLLVKGSVVGAGYLVARVLPRHQSVAVPVGFLLVGVTVTGWNLMVIGSSVLP